MIIVYILAAVLFILLIGIPWLNGVLDFIMAYRFAKNHHTDKTAALLNWNAFKWSWLHQLEAMVEAMPFLRRDLTETFGIRPDDGRTT
jgi:biotin transporter BioY